MSDESGGEHIIEMGGFFLFSGCKPSNFFKLCTVYFFKALQQKPGGDAPSLLADAGCFFLVGGPPALAEQFLNGFDFLWTGCLVVVPETHVGGGGAFRRKPDPMAFAPLLFPLAVSTSGAGRGGIQPGRRSPGVRQGRDAGRRLGALGKLKGVYVRLCVV